MKKVLTTAAALAMLAPTMTSFASTTAVENTTINQSDSVAHQSDLTIEGTVFNSSGQAPAGQLSVTLPTKIGFTIDADGSFIPATGMSIKNASSVAIDVSVAGFTDPTSAGKQGITPLPSEHFLAHRETLDRSFVVLGLEGSGENTQAVELYHNMPAASLVRIGKGGTSNLVLHGAAGTGNTHKNADPEFETKGASDNFKLTFKIAKSSQQD